MTGVQTAIPEFVITRRFAASRQRVWDAWTKPELFATWFGPKGVTTTVLTFDFRPDGMIHARMDNQESGSAIWGKFVPREVSEPSSLVWEHSFADADANIIPAPFFDVWPLRLLTTVTFEDAGDGTSVTVTWIPLDATPEQQQAFAGQMSSMTMGWGGSFDQLDALLAGGADR
jgi:uncharacterized protein YndB with AHSA1/START domain